MDGLGRSFGRDKIKKIESFDLPPADPSIASRVVLPNEDLNPAGRNDYQREMLASNKDERFHKIEAGVQTQQFASRLLKPFFTTADVIQIDGTWFSHEPVLGSIQTTTSEEEASADIQLIAAIVGDSDRRLGHNMTYRQNKAVFYDFGFVQYFFDDMPEFFKRMRAQIETSERTRTYVADKTSRMLRYWKSPEGRAQVESAFRAAGGNMDELFFAEQGKTFDDFYSLLLDRVQIINKMCEEHHEMAKAA